MTEDARFQKFLSTDIGGFRPLLSSDLDNDLRFFSGIHGPLQCLEFDPKRLLRVAVLSRLGHGFKMEGVDVIRRSNHHRIQILHLQHVAVAGERLGRFTGPFLDMGGSLFPSRPVGVTHCNDFEVFCLCVLLYITLVGAESALTTTDLANTDTIVGPDTTRVGKGRRC